MFALKKTIMDNEKLVTANKISEEIQKLSSLIDDASRALTDLKKWENHKSVEPSVSVRVHQTTALLHEILPFSIATLIGMGILNAELRIKELQKEFENL